jgi:hypothetical protein
MVLRGTFNLGFLVAQFLYDGTFKYKLPEWIWAVIAFLFYFLLEDCVLLLFLGLIHAHMRKKDRKEDAGQCNPYSASCAGTNSSFSLSKVFNIGTEKGASSENLV